MKRKHFILIFLSLLASSYVHAPALVFAAKTGTITFTSDAPLELIRANSDQLKGWVNAESRLFAFTIGTSTFKGFKSNIQKKHFNDNYMESARYPQATFEGKIIENIDLHRDGLYNVRAKGNLLIHGVIQERIIKCNLTIKNGQVSVKSNFIVLLADHNIAIPKILDQKLASDIKVEVNAELNEK